MMNKSILDSNILAKKLKQQMNHCNQGNAFNHRRKKFSSVTDEIMAWVPQTFLSNLRKFDALSKEVELKITKGRFNGS